MANYTVYCEFYGKKIKVKNVEAKSKNEAKQEVMKKINFLKIEEDFDITDALDALKKGLGL